MRKTKTSFLYSTEVPVQNTAYSFTNRTAEAGFCTLAAYSPGKEQSKNIINPFPYQPLKRTEVT